MMNPRNQRYDTSLIGSMDGDGEHFGGTRASVLHVSLRICMLEGKRVEE